MDLVFSAALLGLSAILFVVLLLSDRKPGGPGWASVGTASELSSVAITALLSFGICFGVRFFAGEPTIGIKEIVLLAAVLAVYALGFWRLSPRRRLAEYASQRARIDSVSRAEHAEDDKPGDKPTFPRAA